MRPTRSISGQRFFGRPGPRLCAALRSGLPARSARAGQAVGHLLQQTRGRRFLRRRPRHSGPAVRPADGQTSGGDRRRRGGLDGGAELARCGHTVIVLEKHARPGGMFNQGIPAFRLPRDVVDREIEQVRRCGVEIRSGVEVGKDVTLADLLAQHDAVVLAGGTLRRNRLDLPGGDLAGIRHGLDFLLEVNQQRLTTLSGADNRDWRGFTAMDFARAAKRLTSGAVTVCYRRSRREMLVTPGELEELEREGIPLEEMLRHGLRGRRRRARAGRSLRTHRHG